MSSDSRRTSRCFSWMSLNQSTSMSSSRPSGRQVPTRPGLASGPALQGAWEAPRSEEGYGHPPPSPPVRPSQQLSNHSLRCAASPPAEPHGAPGHPAGARWCPPLRGCPPQGCTGQPGPARQHPGHHPSPSAAGSFPISLASSGQHRPRARALSHTLGAEARPQGGDVWVWYGRNPSVSLAAAPIGTPRGRYNFLPLVATLPPPLPLHK